MNIIGFNSVIIDSAAALIKDGKIIAAMEEERFTRKKHDGSFPVNALNECLRLGGLSGSDIDHICCSFDEWRAIRHRVLYYLAHGNPGAIFSAVNSRKKEFFKLTGIASHIESIFGTKNRKILKVNHHLSHAASTFFVSPFSESAILVMDSTGEDTSISLMTGKGNKITEVRRWPYGQSLGALYTSVTEYLGFRPNSGEGKIMGLAAYGEPEYFDEFSKIVKIDKEGTMNLDLSYFTHHLGRGVHCSDKFIRRFGKPRIPESGISQKDKNMAASLQKILEVSALELARYAKRRTGLDNLCLAGGIALNSVMNAIILEESGFQDMYLMPSPSDAGTSLGAALYCQHQLLNKERKIFLETPFLGLDYSQEDIDKEVRNYPSLESESRPDYIECAARLLSQGAILGWFQGKFEFGPRALGHRSILADPRKKDIKDILNARVKFRESFRPFAPAVLYEKRNDVFTNGHDNPFMLFVFKIKESMRDKVPGIVHEDNTGRGQTVSEKASPEFWALIKQFDRLTGVPVVLNTSFNVRGEPIVNSPK
ncbi:MAG TPA: carbamoyltransferase N-terminal domain-containing protein, partial [Candidatus Omnitrophota bacterium]|nr:carbamoyltransferase N-terminal domain-containing protein [Candidatus Omnitrophota bacterium]